MPFATAHAQEINLVPNPGFEEFLFCPGSHSTRPHEFGATHWRSASTLGTPDHFHACSSGEADVPHNWAGVSDAYTGQGYAGIYMWMATQNYREYLQCQLTEPLIADSLYYIRFRYKLSSYSKYAIDRIGLLLTDNPVSVKHDKPIVLIPTFAVVQDSALTPQTGLWEEASFDYVAHGGERFLTLGNFWGNESTRTYRIIFRPIQQQMLANGAYYYIDDVEVIPSFSVGEIPVDVPPFTIDAELNTNYVLRDIQFAFNSYKLEPVSFRELDFVVEYLLRHPKSTVQLFGHTDDVGSEEYNYQLSLNRAGAVGEYLKYAGIPPDRIEVYGYGKRQPLVNEHTETARAINRRVEVRFVQ